MGIEYMFDDLTQEEEGFARILDRNKLPRHIAIIIDGNGRWAKERGLPRIAGHKAGVEATREIARACERIKVDVLTLFLFSTENWARPKREVDALMGIFKKFLKKEGPEIMKRGAVLRGIGRISDLPLPVQREFRKVIRQTKDNRGRILNLALSYGGQDEIIRAIKKIIPKIISGQHTLEKIDAAFFEEHLDTTGLPPPDLLIRSGGEMRLSNFLLWQLAYTEIWVTPVYWPDFKRIDFLEALVDYQRRERKFGKIVSVP